MATSRSALEGGHSAPPRRPRRRQRDRPADPARALAPTSPSTPGIDVLRGRARRAPARRRRRALRRPAARRRPRRSPPAPSILATGGAAALWSRTTNPPGSFGSGLLLARAAGAALADLEFVQFHPTAVAGVPGREGFLVTEAVRGEGATLHDPDGERFVDELAPRDAVARAIFRRAARAPAPRGRASTCAASTRRASPTSSRRCARPALDPATELVPVAPASPLRDGRRSSPTSRPRRRAGLYAVGECACTGLHGANRLASNSLSECFVFGRRAALRGARRAAAGRRAADPGAPAEPSRPAPSRETREAMWRHAGLERDAAGLAALLDDPHPLARLVAASRAGPRGDARRARPRGVPGHRSRPR